MWTEVLNEDMCVTHVGECQILVAIGHVPDHEMRAAMDALHERQVREQAAQRFIEDSRAMRREMDKQMAMFDQLEEAGYDMSEMIP